MLKRLDLGTAFVVALAIAAPAGAQTGGKFTLPTQKAVRQGVEVRPPQTVVVDPYNYYRNPSYPLQPVPVQFTLVPAVLMSDGSIFANFGFGYEPVVRSCNAVVVVRGPVQRIGSNGVVLGQSNALPYTQPVPNQMTASQQMIANGHRLSGPAQTSCFARDGAGRIFVYRRS